MNPKSMVEQKMESRPKRKASSSRAGNSKAPKYSTEGWLAVEGIVQEFPPPKPTRSMLPLGVVVVTVVTALFYVAASLTSSVHKRGRFAAEEEQQEQEPQQDQQEQEPQQQCVDACCFMQFSQDPAQIDDTNFKLAYSLLQEYYRRVKVLTATKIPWTAIDKKNFFSLMSRGIIVAHYPPDEESGENCNLAYSVAMASTNKDAAAGGRVIYKVKSACLRFQSYALAREYMEYQDYSACIEVQLPDNKSVFVEKSSAALLEFDILERWPCCNSNTVQIETEIRKLEHGEELLAEGDELFVRMVQARRAQIKIKDGTSPPVLVWNWGTSDGIKYGGAQEKLFQALRTACGPDNVWSTYHMAFLLRKRLPPAMCAAPFADAATRAFAQGIPPRMLSFVSPETAGFWSKYQGVADMSPDELEIIAAQSRDFFVEIGRKGGKCVCIYLCILRGINTYVFCL
jgi:hypothetical protein